MISSAPNSRSVIGPLMAVLSFGSLAACGSEEDPMGSSTGDLVVTVMTTGTDIPGTFTVTLTGESMTISPFGSVTFTGLEPLDYDLGLSVETNCTVSGANPRTVPILADFIRRETFSVTCDPIAPPGGGATAFE